MTNPKAKELLQKQENGEISQSEKDLLDSWYIQQEISDDIPDLDILLSDQKESAESLVRYIHEKKPVPLWSRIAVAAAAMVGVVLGLWMYTSSPVTTDHPEIVNQNVISPGKNMATLTFANGKAITLSDAKTGVTIDATRLTYDDGTAIDASGIGQLNGASDQTQTITTPRGGTYQVTLSDGTKVWLNAASSLTYTTPLSAKAYRTVKLEGEAYFEVASDKHHPFVVVSRGQQVEVLGTHFNVNSYADEPQIETSLLEGSVKVKVGKIQTVIKPGEQALNNGQRIEVHQVDMDKVVDWKNGKFNFNHLDFRTAMRKIGRWYNVEVVYDASVSDAMEAGGWMSRNNQLSDVLQAIEASGHAKFRIEGKKIIVSK